MTKFEGRIEAADGRDHKVRSNGRSWRVRVRRLGDVANAAPANGGQRLQPAAVSYIVSVALLDRRGNVARNGAGELQVFDPATLTVQSEALASRDVKVGDEIRKAIEARIADAEAKLAGHADRLAAEAEWI